MEQKYEILRQYFEYSSFRGGQEELIDAQLAGRDVFCIMPTGSGKSLCYQIPTCTVFLSEIRRYIGK